MKYIVCVVFGILATLSVRAEDSNEDFVGLLLSDIRTEAYADSVNEEEYSCITIGPSMIEKVIEMMSDKNDQEQDMDVHAEQVKKILPHIKSLRIFTAHSNTQFYYNDAIQLLSKNKNKYKAYRANGNNASNIWLRKKKDKVVEIIQLNKREEDVKVVNFTGDMTNDFVTELLKM